MKVTLLGTGSPEAHVRRASSGYLVEVGADRILLDCGGGVFDRLLQSGRRPSDITHIVFSHLHSDHMMDYARLVHAAWDEGGVPIKVYGPKPIGVISEKLFGRDGVFAHDLVARTEHPASQEVWKSRGGQLPRPWPSPHITEILPGFSLAGPNWSLTTCEVPHAQPYLSCMALRIDTARAKFVYSGDAGPCDTLPKLAQGADLLLHWCYRTARETKNANLASKTTSPADIASLAQRAKVKRLVVTHLRAHMDTDDTHGEIMRQLRSGFDGPSSIAEDLMVFDLP